MRIGPFGLPELLLILVILLLIFGAKRLPEIGSSLGKGIRSFKSSFSGEDEKKAAATTTTAPSATVTPPAANNVGPSPKVGSDKP